MRLHKSVQGENYFLPTCFAVITICSLLAIKGLGFYDGQTAFYAGLAIAMVSCACKILTTKQSLYDWIFILLVCGIAGICWLSSRDKSMLIAAMMLLCVKDVPESRLMKAGAFVWTVCFTFMALRYEIGFSPETILVHPKHGFGYVICHELGYPHPNVLHVSYALLVIFYLYLLDKRIIPDDIDFKSGRIERENLIDCSLTKSNLGELDHTVKAGDATNSERRVHKNIIRELMIASALLMAGNVLTFFNSYSFTGFGMVTVLILLNLILQLRSLRGSSLHRWEEIMLQLILPCGVLFMTAGPLLLHEEGSVGRPFYDLFNKLLNTRYELSWWFLTHEPIAPFGSVLEVPNYRYSMDCSYVNLLVQQGVVPFALFLTGYMLLVHDQLKEHRITELAITIGMLIGGITEPFLFNTSCKNISLIFLGGFLYRKTEALPAHIGGRTGSVAGYRQRRTPFPGNGITSAESGLSEGVKGQNLEKPRVPTAVFRKTVDAFFRHFVPICLAMLLAFCAGAGIYKASIASPGTIYVPIAWTMDRPEGGIILSGSEVLSLAEAGTAGNLMNSRGTGAVEVYGPWEEEFIAVSDSTRKLETFRRTLNAGAWACFITGAIASILLAVRLPRESEEKQTHYCGTGQ